MGQRPGPRVSPTNQRPVGGPPTPDGVQPSDTMQLLTATLLKQLVRNGQTRGDHVPVVRFFDPCGAATWLITEIDPDDGDTLFGLCDLGLGFPELGYVSLTELSQIRNRFHLGIERDVHFKADKPLSQYAEQARCHRRIDA